jgi:hypothetical protein
MRIDPCMLTILIQCQQGMFLPSFLEVYGKSAMTSDRRVISPVIGLGFPEFHVILRQVSQSKRGVKIC